MKNFFFASLLMLLAVSASSQSIIPFDNRSERIADSPSLNGLGKGEVEYKYMLDWASDDSDLKNEIVEFELEKSRLQKRIIEESDSSIVSELRINLGVLSDSLTSLKKKLNALNAEKMVLDSIKGRAVCDSLNNTDKVKVFGVGGVSELQDYESVVGNFSFGAKFRLTDYVHNAEKNRIDPFYLYAMFNYRAAKSEDSISLQKSIVFPAIGRRDFVLGGVWELLYLKNNLHLELTTEMSLTRFRDSVSTDVEGSMKQYEFVSQNFLLGANAFMVFPLNNSTRYMTFGMFPYYQLISVDPKHWEAYGKLLGETQLSPTIHTFGLKTSIGIGGNITFCDVKYVANNRNADSPDLKSLVFTIGTQIAF
jgi:hypothetical protein